MIEGIVASILQDFGQGRGVVRIDTAEGNAMAIGPVAGLTPGQAVTLEGHWTEHPRFGRQYHVSSATVGPPQPGPGLTQWLALAPGIGPATARAITKHLGTNCLEIVKAHPERLEEIDGIGPAKAKTIAKAVRNRSLQDELWEDLVNAAVPTSAISRVVRRYGDNAIDIVRRAPYQLLGVHGIGWKTADEIAKAGGCPPGSPARIKAGVLEVLRQAAKSAGHCYLPVNILLKGEKGNVTGAARLLTLKADTIGRHLEEMEERGALVNMDGAVYGKALHTAEITTAALLARLASAPVEELDTAFYEDFKGDIDYSAGQVAAIQAATSSAVTVITGGPGTGKTTITRAVVDIFHLAGLTVELAAPTGRAAKRLSEATGSKAQTIHRLLQYAPHLGFTRNRHAPLTAQAIIIDEFSMVDIKLASRLFDAIPPGCRIVIVGDVDQLPSVGPGSVLRDVILSETVPVVRLREVFRQAKESRIITTAHAFAHGSPVHYPAAGEDSDFFFHRRNDPEDIKSALSDFLLKHIPRKFGLDPLKDIMVLTPQNKGSLGTTELNRKLQALINPNGESLSGRTIRIGDRVMQIKNNYDLDVFNGDVGRVTAWDAREKTARVDFGDRVVTYDREHLRGLVLAYCATVHKCVAPETLVCTDQGMVEIASARKHGVIATANRPATYSKHFVSEREVPCLKITTRHGYEITVSEDHKLMSWTGNRYQLQEASALEAGTFLRLALDWKDVGSNSYPEPPPSPETDIRAKQWQIPKSLTFDLATFLGLIVADGTIFKRGFRLAKRHPEVVDYFCQLCRDLFGIEPKRIKVMGNTDAAQVNSTQLATWLLSIGGLAPNRKAVPHLILEGNPQIQAHFLLGLFEDGSVALKGGDVDHIEWSSSSEKMSATVQTMLLRQGIASSRAKYGRAWRLSIYGEFISIFQRRIGFQSYAKKRRLHRAHPEMSQKYCVPVDPDKLEGQTRNNARARGTISRRTAAKHPHLTPDLLFFHSPIKTIERTSSRISCVSVPSFGRFLQNGFDGSNSQGSEFPAVIGIVHTSHHWMLRRNLVYTMITRAKRLLVLIGQRHALEVASRNLRDAERYTRLSWVLQDPPKEAPPLKGAETITDRIFTCDACLHTFPSDSPQIYTCPECEAPDQIREITADEE